MSFLIVFLVALLLDVAWAFYTRAIADGLAVRAAVWSGVVGAASLYGIASVVHEPGAAVPWISGLAVGTYLAVWWNGRA